MQNTESHTFHFLSEISKENTYRLLFPDSKAGMAIIWLYEKLESGYFPDGFFKESDIHDALLDVSSVDLDNGKYHLKEHYNAIIGDLQEYFLRYDDEKQHYSFKEYAFSFCKHAKDTLKSFFDPTQIEIICSNLRDKLTSCDNEQKLLEWFSLEFSTFKPRLKSQLDYLDKQIDQSVADLRENRKLNLQEGTILDTLRQIDERFEIIRTQNKELRTAFRVTEEIRRSLNNYSEQYDNDEISKNTHNAITFFQEMRYVLLLIDKRLDRIQPRIKQLFSNLNKPLFNIKIEKFIGFLIRNSTEINIVGSRELSLPQGIHQVAINRELSDFIIVERKSDLFPTKPKKRIVVTENPELKQKAFASTINQVFQQDEVARWLNTLANRLQEEKMVDLSDFFFKILEEEKRENALSLAISVVYRSIKLYEQQSQYEVLINPNVVKSKKGTKTTLWQIIIHQK
ncbi:hypothetical protein [Chitinophaga silvisoli]|uniref:Uncharacterized protein n=1 Tax=Chitinophaga silvisoli TaxID=2291814 RepID=A0A3E1P4F2_9BACT|nr:hypothetical protein [Chitinophaga silvisoli]RFM35037.1 hypothetical protein DXN04_06450 [Chitinophaga silvisoli]